MGDAQGRSGMVDWTTIAVAGFGVIGTLGAGLIGFSGPSWNEQRLQRGRDERDLRRAVRLVSIEIWDVCHELRWVAERSPAELDDPLDADRLPTPEKGQWAAHRETLAALISDQAPWQLAAKFHSALQDYRQLIEIWNEELAERESDERSDESPDPETGLPPTAADDMIKMAKRLMAIGTTAREQLDSLLDATNTPQKVVGSGD
jgi:hypothetical protein